MTLLKFNQNLPSLVDDFLGSDFFQASGEPSTIGKNMPAVNVKENDTQFEVQLAAPGFKKEDFKIEVHNNNLEISSESKKEDEKSNENYSRREFSYSSFSRIFHLPESAEEDKIQANYQDGVLRITIPKRESDTQKGKRMIEIG